MPISDYYTSAGGNTALFAEGQSPASVNDGMRTVQADIRNAFNDLSWFTYGSGDGAATFTYVSGTQFSVSGNLTSPYHNNRRLRAVGTLTGTIYGRISSSTHNAGTTTVTCVWDSGSLQSETLTISLGESRQGIPTPFCNTTQLAAGQSGTGFVLPEKMAELTDLDNPGYIRYPGGIVLQFGSGTTNGSGVATVSYPFGLAVHGFPVVTPVNVNATSATVTAATVNNFSVLTTDMAGTPSPSLTFYWFSMGY